MRRSSVWIVAALLGVPSIAFGLSTPPPGKAAPPVVPYLCSDGHTADVIYQSGSDYRHARALLAHDGRNVELRAAPTLYGVRYRTAESFEGGAPLAWSLRGEEAVLSEAPQADSYTRQERELLRCVRLRGAAAPAALGSGEPHDSGEAHGEHH
jgi:membrane-bound lysozyme inhibitor of c-type lysozyme MliC